MILIKERSNGIDAVRSLAIFGVIATHSGLINFGRFGVQLFFVVTGFLIADLNNRSPYKFIVRRFFRLWPPFFIFTLFIILSKFTILVYPSLDSLTTPVQLFLLFSMFSNLIPASAFVAGSWSVSNEWIYSLVILFRNKITNNFFVIFYSLIFIQFTIQVIALIYSKRFPIEANSARYWEYVWFNTLNPIINAPFFLLGFGLKLKKFNLIKLRLSIALIFFSILVDVQIGHVMPIWVLGCLAIFSLCSHLKYNILISKTLNFVGKRTYGLFLSHYFVIELTNRFFNLNLIGNLLQTILVFVISLFLAEISWRFLEKPSLKASSSIESRFFK